MSDSVKKTSSEKSEKGFCPKALSGFEKSVFFEEQSLLRLVDNRNTPRFAEYSFWRAVAKHALIALYAVIPRRLFLYSRFLSAHSYKRTHIIHARAYLEFLSPFADPSTARSKNSRTDLLAFSGFHSPMVRIRHLYMLHKREK